MAQKNRLLSTFAVTATTSQLCRLVSSVSFPNPDNYNDYEPPGSTPKNTVRVIQPDQANNTDNNTFDFTYYANQDQLGVTTFFAGLKSDIEITVSGTQVWQAMGLKMESNKWDWMICVIDFDGAVNANANSRYWDIYDHYGSDMPWEVGPQNIPRDNEQNWSYLGEGDANYTSCPEGSSKCIFKCSSARQYDTQDEKQDYNYFESNASIAFYYGVFFDDTVLSEGYSVYTNFGMPLLALSSLHQSLGLLIVSALITSTF